MGFPILVRQHLYIESGPCTPSSLGVGPQWLSDEVTLPTSTNCGAVMPGNPGALEWHPTCNNYSSNPIHATEMQSSAYSTWFVTTITDLVALNSLLHRVNTTIHCCFANDYSRQIADSNHTKQFPREVLALVKFLDWNWCAFIFCSLCVCVSVCVCI